MPRSRSPPSRAIDGGQRRRGRARRHAATMRTHVDLDQHVERHAGRARRAADARHGRRVVGKHAYGRALRQCGEARELGVGDDLVGDQHVADAGVDERRGLVDLLAADADGAVLELQPRDVRALVRLGVRPQREATAAHRAGHQVEVALEGVEVEHQRRRVDGRDGIADAGGRTLGHGWTGRRAAGRRQPAFCTAAGPGVERAGVAPPRRGASRRRLRQFLPVASAATICP